MLHSLVCVILDAAVGFQLPGSAGGLLAGRRGPLRSLGRRKLLLSEASDEDSVYDVIVVGSGNGACGFLHEYLKWAPKESKLGWTVSYSRDDVFQLHNARTESGSPIISGRARSMGGGGSINYSMMHESSKWLAKHLGRDEAYWDALKLKLNVAFDRPDPFEKQTAITKLILETAEDDDAGGFKKAVSFNNSFNIPSYLEDDDGDDETGGLRGKQLYVFPTQFNTFGQRTNSGVSIVDWDDDRIHLLTRVKVTHLDFDGSRCAGVVAAGYGLRGDDIDTMSAAGNDTASKELWDVLLRRLVTKLKTLLPNIINPAEPPVETFRLNPDGGKIILCAGSGTPRLLVPHRDHLKNYAIGGGVNDQILLPVGLYVPREELKISPKDIYAPVFATGLWKPPLSPSSDGAPSSSGVVVNVDFFAGTLQSLLYLTSHLYLAFLPIWAKDLMLECPFFFWLAKNIVRPLVSIAGAVVTFLGDDEDDKPEFVTAILKYNAAKPGHYHTDSNKITLRWFDGDQDKAVAKSAIPEVLKLMNKLGTKPDNETDVSAALWWGPDVLSLMQTVYSNFLGIPYEASAVDAYVDHYSENILLSEQHLAGGCLFGDAVDLGSNNSMLTGRVRGTANVHIADLSSIPLPRVSPQMTAYLVGYHVASQIARPATPPN